MGICKYFMYSTKLSLYDTLYSCSSSSLKLEFFVVIISTYYETNFNHLKKDCVIEYKRNVRKQV